MKKVIIIGAGPAGLTAAYALQKESDIQPIILEADEVVGGLSRTVNFGGNRMDIGGHRFFTKCPEVQALWEEILPYASAPAFDDRLLERETEIGKDETAGELFDRLAEMGAELLKETIEKLERNELEPKKQNDAEATKCSMIKKEHGHIDFSKSEKAIHDLVRGMHRWPCAYAMLEGKAVKIWRTRRIPTKKTGSKAGSILCADKQNGLIVKCGDGDIEILELQFPGSKRMSAQAAMLGHELVGKVFD